MLFTLSFFSCMQCACWFAFSSVDPSFVKEYMGSGVGNDATIATAGASGSFELNVMLPVIGRNILESIRLIGNASRVLADRCIDGITANEERCLELAESSPSVVTPRARRAEQTGSVRRQERAPQG